VLLTFAANAIPVGEHGAGNALKLLNQMMFTCINAVSSEVMAIAKHVGVDPQVFYQTVASSSAATVSGLFREVGKNIVNDDFNHPAFTVDLLIKDTKLALQMAQDSDAPSFIAGYAQMYNELAHANGHGNEDTSALYKVFAKQYVKRTCKMRLEFEYGEGTISANLPDSTDVFIPGVTIKDPRLLPRIGIPCMPRPSRASATRSGCLRWRSWPVRAARSSLLSGHRQGGLQPTSHRKIAIRPAWMNCTVSGREEGHPVADLQWLAPRATVEEMQKILGDKLFNDFYPSGQVTSHDSEDWDHLVDIGYTDHGDHVIMNKYVYDADVAIMIGHCQAIRMAGIRVDTSIAPVASPLEEHRRPPCAFGHAPGRFHSCLGDQRDAQQV
jgi:hypothetical protein